MQGGGLFQAKGAGGTCSIWAEGGKETHQVKTTLKPNRTCSVATSSYLMSADFGVHSPKPNAALNRNLQRFPVAALNQTRKG